MPRQPQIQLRASAALEDVLREIDSSLPNALRAVALIGLDHCGFDVGALWSDLQLTLSPALDPNIYHALAEIMERVVAQGTTQPSKTKLIRRRARCGTTQQSDGQDTSRQTGMGSKDMAEVPSGDLVQVNSDDESFDPFGSVGFSWDEE